MKVHLTPELAQLVQHEVQSGRCNSASEVVREALHDRIDKGLSQLDRGEGVDGDDFMQGLIDDLDRLESEGKAG